VYLFLFLPLRMVTIGETAGFLHAAGSLHWGLMLTVFNLSHLAYLLVLPEATNPAGGGAGLMLFLMFLTQFNDVMQYVWGKLLGRQRILVPFFCDVFVREALYGRADQAGFLTELSERMQILAAEEPHAPWR